MSRQYLKCIRLASGDVSLAASSTSDCRCFEGGSMWFGSGCKRPQKSSGWSREHFGVVNSRVVKQVAPSPAGHLGSCKETGGATDFVLGQAPFVLLVDTVLQALLDYGQNGENEALTLSLDLQQILAANPYALTSSSYLSSFL